MARLSDTTIKKALREGVKPLYIVAGNDAFLVESCVQAICQARGGEARVFDALSADTAELDGAIYNMQLIPAPQAIVIENLFAGSVSEPVFSYYERLIGDIPADAVIVVRYFSDSGYFSVPKKAEKLAANAVGSDIVVATAKTGAQAAEMVAALVRRQGSSCNKDVAARISFLCADDMMLASNEVKKLAALSGYGEITMQHVESLCTQSTEAGVYDMLRQIERKNKKAALSLLKDMLEARSEPIMICSVLSTAFINIFRALMAQQNGVGEQQMTADFGYRKGDKKIPIAFRQARSFSKQSVYSAIAVLTELDEKLKSSVVDNGILLETAVCELIETL